MIFPVDQPTRVRSGEELELDHLIHYLQRHLKFPSDEVHISQFPSGFSNLTYLLRSGTQEYVLRRPPYGAQIKSGHDMFREFRILTALYPNWKYVPKPLLYCEDQSILGAPFYIMERIEGFILRTSTSSLHHPPPALMGKIARSFIAALSDLHDFDYRSAGLGDLGHPQGYVNRQIHGWSRRYFAAATEPLDTLERVIRWLQVQIPEEGRYALIHNDYKYDNLILARDDPSSIRVILDWEMATIGDPLMDLGTTLGYWVNADDPPWFQKLALNPSTIPGNPSRQELVDAYFQASNQKIPNIIYYYVYGLFKVAVIVQQIYYRYKKGHTNDPRFASLDQVVKGLSQMALQAINRQRIDRLFEKSLGK